MNNLVQYDNEIRLQNFTSTSYRLDVGNYVLCKDGLGNIFLKKIEPFKIPKKLYGDFSYLERYLKSYNANPTKNLGILLSGSKGSGKTIAAQLFCQMADKPVIMITEHFDGQDFETFISNPAFSDSIIFIDEFEKIFDMNECNSMLALMDGIYSTRLIFLLTVNDAYRINNKMQNRLSRIKYQKIFNVLEESVVDEVLDDLLDYPEYKQDFKDFVSEYQFITMDILCSLVKEVNLFNETPKKCASYLNLTHEELTYSVNVIKGEKTFPCTSKTVAYPFDDLYIEYSNQKLVDEDVLALIEPYSYIDLSNKDFTMHPNGVIVDITDDIKIELIRINSMLAF